MPSNSPFVRFGDFRPGQFFDSCAGGWNPQLAVDQLVSKCSSQNVPVQERAVYMHMVDCMVSAAHYEIRTHLPEVFDVPVSELGGCLNSATLQSAEW